MFGAASALWTWAMGLGVGVALWTLVSWLRSNVNRLESVENRLGRVETDLRQAGEESVRLTASVEAATRRSEEASNRAATRVIQTLANFRTDAPAPTIGPNPQLEALSQKIEAVLGRIQALEARPAPDPRVPDAVASQMAQVLDRLEAYRQEAEAGRESLLHAFLDHAEDTRLRLHQLGGAVAVMEEASREAPAEPPEPRRVEPAPAAPRTPVSTTADENYLDIVTAATRNGPWSSEPTMLLGEAGARAAAAARELAVAEPDPVEESLQPLPFPTLISGGVPESDEADIAPAALLRLWNEGSGSGGVERHLDFVRGRVAGHWTIRPLAAYRDRIYLAENLRARHGENRFLLLPRIGSWCTDVADVFDVTGLFAAHAYALKGYVVSQVREPARFWTEVGLLPDRIGPERLDHEDIRRGSVEVRAVQ